MMTTLAAALGAVPLAIGFGDGAELRRPLGIAIVGGLVASQVLTLFTTPVVYLALDRFRSRRRRRAAPLPPFKEYPPDARALFPPSRARTASLCAVRLLDGAAYRVPTTVAIPSQFKAEPGWRQRARRRCGARRVVGLVPRSVLDALERRWK
jgi:hypothetical protein